MRTLGAATVAISEVGSEGTVDGISPSATVGAMRNKEKRGGGKRERGKRGRKNKQDMRRKG